MSKRRLIGCTVLAVVAAACGAPAPEPAAPATAMTAVERGEYLVTTGLCNDCHTPAKMGPNGPEPDMERLLSGHPQGLDVGEPPRLEGEWMFSGSQTLTAWAGPWGISYSANLTPDPTTGMGAWTEDMFISAMRTGKHLGTSRPILPPMPWPLIAKYTDEDLQAMFAYLQSIPAIQNQVPNPVINEMPPAP